MRIRLQLCSALLLAAAAIASCDDECAPDVKVCHEADDSCQCAERCTKADACPSGQFCSASLSACVWLQPGQLVEGCGRSGEQCCELPKGATPNACLEPLSCEDLVCIEGP